MSKEKTNKKQKWVKKRHSIIFHLIKPLGWLYLKFAYKYKYQKFKIKKKQKYIIIANHQTTLDPVFVAMSFNKLPYFVTNDTLVHIKYASWWLTRCFGIIPKSKGKSDFLTVKTMLQVLKENGSVGLFPEGNRTISGGLCCIPPAISKVIKQAKVPVILYNLCGGYGVEPRWSNKKRKGHFEGKIKRVLSVEEINNLSIEEIQNIVEKELNHIELPTKYKYKSKRKAEKIERVLYLCPECQSVSTIHSVKNEFTCEHCNTTWQYQEDLTITKNQELYKYQNVLEWYNYQLDDVRKKDYGQDRLIFTDDNLVLEISKQSHKRELISTGSCELTKDKLIFKNDNKEFVHSFNFNELEGVALSMKQQIIFRHNNLLYTIQNNKKLRDDFNALKYVLTINYIQSKEKENQDEFFGI